MKKMKKMKKIASLLMTVAMVFSMIATASAADDYSITIKNPDPNLMTMAGHTFEAYCIFDIQHNANFGAVTYVINDDFKYDETTGKGFKYVAEDGTEYFNDTLQSAITTATVNDVAEALRAYLYNTDETKGPLGVQIDGDDANDIKPYGEPQVVGKEDTGVTEITIPCKEPGYYLILGSVTAVDEELREEYDTIYAAAALTNTDPYAVVTLKVDAPKVDKVIVNADSSAAGGNGKGHAEDMSDPIRFTITSRIPRYQGYDYYYYAIHDDYSDGLDMDMSTMKITVTNSQNVTTDITDKVTLYDRSVIGTDADANGETAAFFAAEKHVEDDPETTEDESVACSCDFVLKFPNLVTSDYLGAGDIITITYTGFVNDDALIRDEETNKVKLIYSNNPFDEEQKCSTPEHVTYVYDFDLIIDKYESGSTSTKLAGAEFMLYKVVDNQNYYYQKVTTDADGKTLEQPLVEWTTDKSQGTVVVTDSNGYAAFQGLDSGEYMLEETKAPAGYTLAPDQPVTITITYNEDGSLKSTSATSVDGGQYSQTVSVANSGGIILPETGGIGTTIFYIAGATLALGAIVLFITKRRMEA